MTRDLNGPHVHVGDWLEVTGVPGVMPRRGQVLEVFGNSGHAHYRVRWDEEHESLFYPTDGAAVVHAMAGHARNEDHQPARS